MKSKSVLSAFILAVCFALCGCGVGGLGYVLNANSVDNSTTNGVAIQAESNVVTMRDIEQFLKDKREHYPLSDEFIEKYQQTSGGYIDLAKKTAGMVVDKEKHEPNQKWHFFDSWLYPSVEDGSLTWEESAQNRVYGKLLCPELLLWIYEACGVDPVKVKAAKDVAEQGKVAKLNVSTIAKNMRACVSWEDLANAITSYTPSESITLSPNKLTLTVGDDAAVTATVVANDMSGVTQWRVTEGAELISIDANGNTATVHAIAKGAAKITASYGDSLVAECAVTVKEPLDPSLQTSAKYNIVYDLGTRVTAKQITDADELFNVFRLDGEGVSVITSISQLDYMYGGASGGRSDTAWHVGDIIKFGTGSVQGSMTIELNRAVSRIIITGYIDSTNCMVRVGDSDSTDWKEDETDDGKTTEVKLTAANVNVISKEVAEARQTSTMTFDFASTTSIKIAATSTTSTKKPLYITAIEFVFADNAQ